MSVALILYYFFHLEGVQALPLAETNQRISSTCNDLNNCRNTSDIVWSCLTTIFACTWVAVHPNIPAPRESWFETGIRHFGIFLMALIAPELVIVWAMRQWLVSRRLARKHRTKGWTQTHGFFALMGGFLHLSSDKAPYTLTPEKLDELLEEGKIEFPKITKEDIEDKSKGDIISKGFALMQTSWFVLQCIGRGVERLPMTELELVTLAFAVLNLATYALWWHKPLNVHCPFAIQKPNEQPYRPSGAESVRWTFKRVLRQIIETWRYHFLVMMLLPAKPFLRMMKDSLLPVTGHKVPSFYSGDNGDDKRTAGFASAAFAVIFGALHCIAWTFEFPSHKMEILWRTCSLAITCLPVTLAFYTILLGSIESFLSRRLDEDRSLRRDLELWFRVIANFIFLIIYVTARVILLVEAFVLLKSLPPGAFQTVQWTTFIPHV